LIVTEEDIRQLGWEKEYREWGRKFEELKEKIAKRPYVKHDLYILKKANADPDVILEALTHIVRDIPMGWRKGMKRDQAKLVRTAAVLHSAARRQIRCQRTRGATPEAGWLY